jgi:palmitoyltransferase ZDHHC9/14/18
VPTLPCPHKRRVGRLVVFYEKSDSKDAALKKFICVAGPCWPMLCLTVSLIVGISAFILMETLPRLSFVWGLLTIATLVNVISALLWTGCSDPGISPRYDSPDIPVTVDDEEYGLTEASSQDKILEPDQSRVHRTGARVPFVWSEDASAYRKHGVVYCHESRALIEDIDHFCPWTGTTIGGGNMRYFYWFLGSLVLHICILFAGMFTSP